MRLAQITNALYRQPWNITADGWLTLHEIVQSRFFSESANLDLSAFVNPRPDAEIDDHGIAHIHVSGTLGKHLSQIERTCGNTGYEEIEAEILAARSHGARGFLFHINSPGGMAAGNIETASLLASIEEPTAAWVDELAASAAYAIASGADFIAAAPSAQVGSIGTILPLVDVSGAWEQRGWKPAYITHSGGDLKDATWPPSFTEAHRAHLQEMVDDHFAQFRDHVLRFRAVPPDAMRGQTLLGRKAKEANLVDHIGSYADTYGELVRRVDNRAKA
ncbi:MAG: S49 family peptidase [Opitutales bacterium]|nr:S49 family peptidase [Opitutales bacterium]